MGVNVQKYLFDLHMYFNVHNELEFDLEHAFEGHIKVKKIFLKIYSTFQNWLKIKIPFVFKVKVMVKVISNVKFFDFFKFIIKNTGYH